MEKILLRLRIEYALVWFFSALLAVLFDMNILEKGMLVGNYQMEYFLNTIGISLTFFVVFLALKMFSFRKNATRFIQSNGTINPKVFIRLSELRLFLLLLAILVNIAVYYATLNNTGGLCTLILLLASLFCWPVELRGQQEEDNTNTEE